MDKHRFDIPGDAAQSIQRYQSQSALHSTPHTMAAYGGINKARAHATQINPYGNKVEHLILCVCVRFGFCKISMQKRKLYTLWNL